MSAGRLVAEPLVIHRLARGPAVHNRVHELFDQAGLRRELVARYRTSSPAVSASVFHSPERWPFRLR
jgi:hypothetical protein